VRYIGELEFDQSRGMGWRLVRDFFIRAYPNAHVVGLSKVVFKKPEYSAACHKQFVDEEVNRVGWVQLQNQFDNWRTSRWVRDRSDPAKTVECRECHMPLVASHDPGAGGDPNADDRPPDAAYIEYLGGVEHAARRSCDDDTPAAQLAANASARDRRLRLQGGALWRLDMPSAWHFVWRSRQP
jgi:hypothetical protein